MVYVEYDIVVLHEGSTENHNVCDLWLNRDRAILPRCSKLLGVARVHDVEGRRHLEPGVAKHQKEARVPSEVAG